ncbi:flavin-containing monooxygenase [Actinoalloteichus caeruleus]|uniref:Monooxygenase n=1 Tax=Actinoalloteichus caeruleus DSM 43889 TaxID=1120930 RepID=A0ABT1JEQ2_ACTCY|nr:hypothetical protein [Actinoalloteichus caeruleus]MCP2330985.1 hypothetical protein [Actinoalloteichus caeruleus DSM 43889]
MTRLADKRVAVVGTGATGIQCIPPLGRDAGHLYVFQRTPAAVDSRGNRPTSPEWAGALALGWQRRRQENFTAVVCGVDQDEDLVADGWTELFRSLRVPLPGLAPHGSEPEGDAAERMELEDFRRMNHLRSRVERCVRDPETAEALKPWYRQFCKRPGFSDDYLATFNRPTVTLVDTRGRGVERATEHGLVSGGVEYAVDCVVLATGFSEGTPYEPGFGGWIRGRHGVRLSEHWRNGVRTLHGLYSHGFPNCFLLGPSQNGMSINFSHSLDEQARHLAAVIDAAERSGAWYVEPTAEAEVAWVEEVRRSGSMDQEYLLACTPGSYNGEGRPVDRPDTYGGHAVQFHGVMRRWRFTGGMTDVLRAPVRAVPVPRHD